MLPKTRPATTRSRGSNASTSAFLVNERGLSPLTVGKYLPVVHAFLTERFGTGAVALETLVARDANRFIVRHSQGLRPLPCQGARRGVAQLPAPPAPARGTSPSTSPARSRPSRTGACRSCRSRFPPEGVESVLESCDCNTAVGRRDHAILLLLARLGLRGGEVATLTLEDIDWDKGLVTLTGKATASRGAAPARRSRDRSGGLSAGRPPVVRDAARVCSRR